MDKATDTHFIQSVWAPTLFDTRAREHSQERRERLGHSLTFHLTDLRGEAAAPVASARKTFLLSA